MKISPVYAKTTDDELLSLIKNGEEQAFVCIYDRYWQEMYACAFQIFPNRETCEDLIHDVFLYLWNSRDSLQIRSVKDYLYISVKNRSLNLIRSRKNNLMVSGEEQPDIPSSSTSDEKLLVKEIKSIFEKAVLNLPEKCREILILSRNEQLSNKEIASRLQISLKTVENQINIGLKKIRLLMGDFLLFYFIYFFFG